MTNDDMRRRTPAQQGPHGDENTAQQHRDPADPECAVLGAILIDAGAIGRVAEWLRSDDFDDDQNALVFDAALGLWHRGEPVDVESVADALRRLGALERIGGVRRLEWLRDSTPTAAVAAPRLVIEPFGRLIEARARRPLTRSARSPALPPEDAETAPVAGPTTDRPRYLARGAVFSMLVIVLLVLIRLGQSALIALASLPLAALAAGPWFAEWVDQLNPPLSKLAGAARTTARIVTGRAPNRRANARSVRTTVRVTRGQRVLQRWSRLAPPAVLLAIANIVVGNPVGTKIAAAHDATCLAVTLDRLSALCDSGIGTTTVTLPDGGSVHVGLIDRDHRGPFDLSNRNDPEKSVEDLIWTEDGDACARAHITLAVATTLSRSLNDITTSADSIGIEDLRGAYLAQAGFNRSPDHRTKLCLVIANAGVRKPSNLAVTDIVHRLLLYSRWDQTFRGIVGFPTSGITTAAVKDLQAWYPARSIMLVSPSATTTDLNDARDFYRVVSSDRVQAARMVDFLVDRFQAGKQGPARIAIFRDHNDPYSRSLAYEFSSALRDGLKADFVQYTEQDPGSIIKAVSADPAVHNDDFIYFAGYSNDLDTLEGALRRLGRSIPILGGDGLYDLSRYLQDPYSIVYSTVYSPPRERNENFSVQYANHFPLPSVGASSALAQLPPHSVLAYDATTVYLKTLENLELEGAGTGLEQFRSGVQNVAFNGLSGPLVFRSGRSDPQDKAVYVVCTDRAHQFHVAAAFPQSDPVQGKIVERLDVNLCR